MSVPRHLPLSARLALGLAPLTLAVGCTEPEKAPPPPPPPVYTPPPVTVDGSSTVQPISRGVLALYASRLVTDVVLGQSGTGGGFKKFCAGELDINTASRPISPQEARACEEKGVNFIELPIAVDGVVVVVPKDAEFVKSLTVEELRRIWAPTSEGQVKSWRDVRKSFPEVPLRLFGPGLESGTYDFFTEAVNGSAGASRSDYEASGDDDVIAARVSETPGALGYFGLAHHAKHGERLRAVAIDDGKPENGDGPVAPSAMSVTDGSYQPLARPLFLYVNRLDADRREVSDFVQFYLRSVRLVAPDVGGVGLSAQLLELVRSRFERRVVGSAFSGLQDVVGLTLADLLRAEEDVTHGDAEPPAGAGVAARKQP
jgi:phosphate transport system substrate-binding protein